MFNKKISLDKSDKKLMKFALIHKYSNKQGMCEITRYLLLGFIPIYFSIRIGCYKN